MRNNHCDFQKGRQVDYVLGDWSAEERETIEEHIKLATEFIKGFGTIGLNMTMTNLNNK
jgi:PTH1 family peptidyl-tRNA hydrolase